MNLPANLRVKITGVRGVYPDALNERIVYAFAKAFSQKLPDGPLLIGYDARSSGEALKSAAIAGFTAADREVVWDTGVAPLPTVQTATLESDSAGAVVVTASHNPDEYNGLKLLDQNGEFISEGMLADISSLVQDFSLEEIPDNSSKDFEVAEKRQQWAYDIHLKALEKIALSGKEFVVAVDAVNASASDILPTLLERIGCEVIELAGDSDQQFPHKPKPQPENLEWTKQQLSNESIDLGLVTDPDADRLLLLDENKRILSEEITLPLALRGSFILRDSQPGGLVVTNLSTSKMVDDAAAEFGADVIRTKVGEVNVVEAMHEQNADFGGEGNGGVIEPKVHYGRDALIGAVHIINLLRKEDTSLSRLAADMNTYTMQKVNLPAGDIEDEGVVYDAVQENLNYDTTDTTDGLRLSWETGFLHMRPSTTEPLFRIMAEEKDSQSAEAVIRRVKAVIENS